MNIPGRTRPSSGPRPPPSGVLMPMVIAGGLVSPVKHGANQPGAQRGKCHSSATHGPSTLVISKVGHMDTKPGTAAMEENGMADGTRIGATHGTNFFDSRIEKTLTNPTNTTAKLRSGCNGRKPSSDSCAGKTRGTRNCSRRSKD